MKTAEEWVKTLKAELEGEFYRNGATSSPVMVRIIQQAMDEAETQGGFRGLWWAVALVEHEQSVVKDPCKMTCRILGGKLRAEIERRKKEAHDEKA